MNTNIYILRYGGAFMDEQDSADFLAIELALRNPAAGTADAATLDRLAAEASASEAERSHPITGALCFCRIYCEGLNCHCWCHTAGGAS